MASAPRGDRRPMQLQARNPGSAARLGCGPSALSTLPTNQKPRSSIWAEHCPHHAPLHLARTRRASRCQAARKLATAMLRAALAPSMLANEHADEDATTALSPVRSAQSRCCSPARATAWADTAGAQPLPGCTNATLLHWRRPTPVLQHRAICCLALAQGSQSNTQARQACSSCT